MAVPSGGDDQGAKLLDALRRYRSTGKVNTGGSTGESYVCAVVDEDARAGDSLERAADESSQIAGVQMLLADLDEICFRRKP